MQRPNARDLCITFSLWEHRSRICTDPGPRHPLYIGRKLLMMGGCFCYCGSLRALPFSSPVAWSILSLAGKQKDTCSVCCCSEPGIWNWRVHIMQNEELHSQLSTSIEKPLYSWTCSSLKKNERRELFLPMTGSRKEVSP